MIDLKKNESRDACHMWQNRNKKVFETRNIMQKHFINKAVFQDVINFNREFSNNCKAYTSKDFDLILILNVSFLDMFCFICVEVGAISAALVLDTEIDNCERIKVVLIS